MGMGSWKIYTLSTCPHCKEAKSLLQKKEIPFREIVCDDQRKKEKVNTKFNGHRTYPKCVDPSGKFIGGNSDLQKHLK